MSYCKNKGINEVISLWRLIQAYVNTREVSKGKAESLGGN